MVRIATVTVALLIAAASVARADDVRLRDEMTQLRQIAADAVANGQHYPIIELVTMGVGSLTWERHGHIALCVTYEHAGQDACYNYGVATFEHPLAMAFGFLRGTHSFWVGKSRPQSELSIYQYEDRTCGCNRCRSTTRRRSRCSPSSSTTSSKRIATTPTITSGTTARPARATSSTMPPTKLSRR